MKLIGIPHKLLMSFRINCQHYENQTMKNVFAVVVGIFIGGVLNMGLITVSGEIIPPPDGVDPTDMESLKASMHLFSPRHFIFPFLAHALGTLVGALVAAKIASSHPMRFALSIGAFFLVGGISMAMMLPAPLWFNVLDLGGAYLPMAWIGGIIASRKESMASRKDCTL